MADQRFITLSPWAKDIAGKVFGDLTAIGPVGTSKRGVDWHCQCACGNTHVATARALLRGNVRSCGCLARRLSVERGTKHGLSRSGEYRAWRSMIERCCNPAAARFADYGGRGISVCDRWRASFPAFVEDMGRRPSRAHSLDRVDNNLGYSPDNCRWATAREQANNRRNTTKISYLGQEKTLAEWMRVLGLPGTHAFYLYRILKGWDPHRAFTAPSRKASG